MNRRITTPSFVLRIVLLVAMPLAACPMQHAAFAQDPPFVYHALFEKVTSVSGTGGTAGVSPLPASLVIAPGRYSFAGNTYEVREQGLYRFCHPRKENQQRVVYDEHHGDIEAFLSALAWIGSHGNSDDGKSVQALTQKATTAKLFITCGTISRWALDVLKAHHIRARFASTLTLDPWNSYDNGHSMIEVYREDLKKWVLCDVDENALFTHENVPLSLVEMIERSATDAYEIKRLATDVNVDISNFKGNGYDFGFLMDSIQPEDGVRRWYKRVLHVPVLENCFYLPEPNAIQRARVEGYPGAKYSYLEKAEFLKRFY